MDSCGAAKKRNQIISDITTLSSIFNRPIKKEDENLISGIIFDKKTYKKVVYYYVNYTMKNVEVSDYFQIRGKANFSKITDGLYKQTDYKKKNFYKMKFEIIKVSDGFCNIMQRLKKLSNSEEHEDIFSGLQDFTFGKNKDNMIFYCDVEKSTNYNNGKKSCLLKDVKNIENKDILIDVFIKPIRLSKNDESYKFIFEVESIKVSKSKIIHSKIESDESESEIEIECDKESSIENDSDSDSDNDKKEKRKNKK